MGLIDSTGTFIGTIVDESVGLSSGGFPQWVARLKAEKKWVDDAVGMKHFGLEAPAYVDWSSFEEEITAYLVLFKSQDTFDKESALLNYEQVQLATKWDGTDFEGLNGPNKGKEILFRTEENTWNNKTRIQVSWVDAPDASPERQLRKLDANDIKSLSAKLRTAPKVAAKAAPAKPGPSKPVSPTPAAAATSVAPAAATPPTTPPAASTTKAKPGPKPKAAPAATLPVSPETAKAAAWNTVIAAKGDMTDDEIADAWLSAMGEVGNGEKQEAEFTVEDWAKVQKIVARDCSLQVA